MVRICYAGSDDKEEWNTVVLNSAEGRFCHLYDWYEILPKVYNYRPVYLTVKENGNMIAVFPSFLIRSNLFGNRLVSMPFSSYGGPLFRKYSRIMNEKLLSRIVSVAESSNSEYVEIRSPSNQYMNEIKQLNFIENTNYNYCTFLIDLKRNCNSILLSLRKSTRRAIRIAERKGISIKECQRERDLKIFYDLYLPAMRKHGTPPHSFGFFKEIWDRFHRDYLKIFFAIYEDKVISTMLFLVFNRQMKYGLGASKSEKQYLKLCPNNLLFWHAIKFGKERDLDVLNLGRTRPRTGVYLFKAGWGGRKVPLPYFCNVRNVSKLPYLDPCSPKYRFLIQIWKKLPDIITTRLGPEILAGTGG